MSKYFKHIGLLLIITLSVSCKKGFDEMNKNPNAITDELINADYLFPKSVIKAFDSYNVGVNTELWALMTWTQMVASTNSVSLDEEFQYGGSDVDLIWSVYYTEALSNVNEVIKLTDDVPADVNKNAIARIWKAYLFHIVTDLWGDVPYSEALNGNEDEKILYPKYDTQQDIYSDLLSELKNAITQMDASKNLLETDMIYNGDITLWEKFANTLRLRLAVRIYDVDPTLATTNIQELITANNFISSASEAAYFDYSYGDNVRSPIAEGYRQSQVSELPSQLFVNTMLDDNDPRISYMIEETQEFDVIGIFDPYVGTSNFSSSIQDGFYKSDFDEIFIGGAGFENPEARAILTYEETNFLLAEVALKGLGGNASSFLKEGVVAHMNYLGVSDSLITIYADSLAGLTMSQEIISKEKWKALFMRDGFEAYAEWRRTGYPKVLDESGVELDQGLIPTRLPYPSTEISRNENIIELNISPTDMKTKVWWDIH